jgi:hypothetical protein
LLLGLGGTVTGKGADLLIIDDPHSEQEAALAQGILIFIKRCMNGIPLVLGSVYSLVGLLLL